MQTMKPTPLFVYGTLKYGYPNHFYLSSAHFIGSATTTGLYGFYQGPDPHEPEAPLIPYLLAKPTPGNCPVHVHGEVWEVGHSTLTQLDQLEGHPKWYQRKKITVRLDSGNSVRAFAYFLTEEPKDTLRPIESGHF